MNPTALMVAVAVANVLLICIAVLVVKRCYIVPPIDTAIVKTGWGRADVTTAGGMLVYPVINQVQTVSLKWQSVSIEFAESDPLRFLNQHAFHGCVTAWVAVDTERESVLEAAQSLGERCSEKKLMEELYATSMRQAIRKAARETDHDAWMNQLPEISPDLMQAIEACVESFHVVHRVTIES